MQHSYIHIINLEHAENNILQNYRLKDEINFITGMFAVSLIPVKGAVDYGDFRERGEWVSGLLSVKFSFSNTPFSLPVQTLNLQGFLNEKEGNFNYNRQVLFRPLPLNLQMPPNTHIKIKYRDHLSPARYTHDIKLLLTYYDKN